MGDGVFRKEIVQRCSANAEFLIAHMTSKGNEPVDGIRWPDTPFYAWLCRSFPVSVPAWKVSGIRR